jgi:hypothetical protein
MVPTSAQLLVEGLVVEERTKEAHFTLYTNRSEAKFQHEF